MGYKSILIIFGIVLLGFTLRIYRITSLPMYGDELTMVYDTYSILKTGKDATGEGFPLTFRMGAGRPGGYIYASLPFVYFFGPSEWGVRGLSVFSALGIIVLMYFLGKKLFSEKVGFIASFLTSISIWDIYLSRGGFEAHFALFLALLGIVAFINSKYILWSVTWGFAIFTYPTFKLTLPLIFILFLWYVGVKNLIKNRFFLIGVLILTVFGGLVVRQTLKGRSEERFLKINIFSDSKLQQQIIQKINEERSISTLPVLSRSIFYNKPLEYSRVLLENYMDNISPRFLYLRGDGNPRHNPGEWGMFYLVELPLFFVGIAHLWNKKKKSLVFLASWILIVPLASMFIRDTHGLRNGLMLPAFILISAYALTRLSRKMAILFVILMFIQLTFVLTATYFYAPNKFSSFWSEEAKTASLEAIKNQGEENIFTLSTKIDNIEYAYPVYAKIDPDNVIEQFGKYPKIYGNIVISDK
ncbi:MAG: hypothetical protein AAB535_00405 [Patescibacteria group bacterium]